ncbi:hypothetical protein [Cyanobium gracile]|uniref:Uncharacterized protein n=1 Tax=Cyanobium gracile UHCC 0281 TaxID=3110309 RepID=A0ABU5SZ84_9CYAN|nr:hypothetical protein [Cyanobium gracile]MEA5443756.1 hypothetical protein [Cyanobium gracile UHCC 0281]
MSSFKATEGADDTIKDEGEVQGESSLGGQQDDCGEADDGRWRSTESPPFHWNGSSFATIFLSYDWLSNSLFIHLHL